MESLDYPEKASILVVDDTPDNLALMSDLLKDHYRVRVANNGERALKIVRGDAPPDLILLDIMMPGLSGHDVCEQLKADSRTREIPIIFLTAMTAVEDEKKGLEMGAVDYITKPISPPIVLARVATHLKIKAAADFLRDKNAFLEAEVARRTREVNAIQDVTIIAMASLAETRDNDTGNHIRRTQFYVKALAEHLKDHPRFSRFLTDPTINMLYKSAPLHDIGKVGIPDRILLKPGRFTPEEFEIMKTHTTLGRDAIQAAEDRLGHGGRVPALRQGDRLLPPGEMERQRLPHRQGRRRHPHVGTPDGRRRRLRRPDQPPHLQGRHAARKGGADHGRTTAAPTSTRMSSMPSSSCRVSSRRLPPASPTATRTWPGRRGRART